MDLYVILGLDRSATTADVKRAYRRLARRYHPGINPGDRTAETVFKRISEAYETLVDPDRRRMYDARGDRTSVHEGSTFEFAGFDFSVSARGRDAATFNELFADVLHPAAPGEADEARPGPDLHAALTLSLEEALRGVERQVVVTRQVSCPACAGMGQVRTVEGRCPHCQGSGSLRWARGHMVFSKKCPQCQGTGRQRVQPCGACAGHGRAVRSDAIGVVVPPGVSEGTRLRVPERGHAGLRGGRHGDLYVEVHVREHPVFRRQGDDLHMVLPVAVHEAVLGARIDVPTLDGRVKVTVPPGTQGGRLLRIAGRGAPNPSGHRGDLVLEVKLVLPAAVDERSRELMREFARLNGEDVRRDLQV